MLWMLWVRTMVIQDEIVDVVGIVHGWATNLGHSTLRLLHLVWLLHLRGKRRHRIVELWRASRLRFSLNGAVYTRHVWRASRHTVRHGHLRIVAVPGSGGSSHGGCLACGDAIRRRHIWVVAVVQVVGMGWGCLWGMLLALGREYR